MPSGMSKRDAPNGSEKISPGLCCHILTTSRRRHGPAPGKRATDRVPKLGRPSYFAAQKSEPHFLSSPAASAGLAVRVDGLMKPDVWDVRDLRKKLRELLFELGVLGVGAV